MTSYQYRKSHCGDKTILRPSYLHNGFSYTGKTTSLYWIRALVCPYHHPFKLSIHFGITHCHFCLIQNYIMHIIGSVQFVRVHVICAFEWESLPQHRTLQFQQACMCSILKICLRTHSLNDSVICILQPFIEYFSCDFHVITMFL